MPRGKKEHELTEVEAALLKRALGFQMAEEYSEDIVDKKSGETVEILKRRRVEKTVPPDVRALLFYLKNRCPERWRERVEAREDEPDYEFGEEESEL